MKPLLYVDVDGVISLWGFDPVDSDSRPAGGFVTVDGIPHFLSSEAGRHLLDLASEYELIWCTGWEERANEYLVAGLGLPGPLPVLQLDGARQPGDTTPGHWKLPAVMAHAGSRPLAWIDDAFNAACYDWASERAEPTLLVPTSPEAGLRGEHAERLRAWAAALRS